MKKKETEEAVVPLGVLFPWQWGSTRGSYFIENNLDNNNSKNSDNPLMFLVVSLGHFLGLCHGVSISFLSPLLVTCADYWSLVSRWFKRETPCLKKTLIVMV